MLCGETGGQDRTSTEAIEFDDGQSAGAPTDLSTRERPRVEGASSETALPSLVMHASHISLSRTTLSRTPQRFPAVPSSSVSRARRRTEPLRSEESSIA
jgi:hypothetical protein